MILEVSGEELRDIAAAVSVARRRDAEAAPVLGGLERKVLVSLHSGRETLELLSDEAHALQKALTQRAYDQRHKSEGTDYADLADRIGQAIDDESIPLGDVIGGTDES